MSGLMLAHRARLQHGGLEDTTFDLQSNGGIDSSSTALVVHFNHRFICFLARIAEVIATGRSSDSSAELRRYGKPTEVEQKALPFELHLAKRTHDRPDAGQLYDMLLSARCQLTPYPSRGRRRAPEATIWRRGDSRASTHVA